MGLWNQWLTEREKAPLDHLRECLQTRWTAAQLCVDDCCEKGEKTQHVSLQAEQKHPKYVMKSSSPDDDMVNHAVSMPDLLPAPSPGIHDSSAAVTHANQCCHCKGAREDAKVENIDGDRSLSSGSQPLYEQSGCARVSDEQAQFHRKADSKSMPVAETSPSLMRKGARVEVWSNSRQDWVAGLVLDYFETESRDRGFKVPAGSYKVCYAGNTIKWIKPECVPDMLRPLGPL
jgi:hypothetical protein